MPTSKQQLDAAVAKALAWASKNLHRPNPINGYGLGFNVLLGIEIVHPGPNGYEFRSQVRHAGLLTLCQVIHPGTPHLEARSALALAQLVIAFERGATSHQIETVINQALERCTPPGKRRSQSKVHLTI
jgi:hypothetical protein